MKIVVAMDSFKESLSAQAACDIVARTIAVERPEAEIVVRPVADGGEGTAAAMIAACGGEWIPVRVTGPLAGRQVDAGYAWFGSDETALVEMAAASGLQLLEAKQRNPLLTTTFGTGELIAAAAGRGAKKIFLAVGGSATVDGGTGAATALGWRFLDARGEALAPGGGALVELARIVEPARPLGVPVDVLCDVKNPLCGVSGAARVYGPQKGATGEMVERLEAGLLRLAMVVKDQLGVDLKDMPGAGAAGGLAGGAVAFFGGRLISGIEFVIGRTGLAKAIAEADWVITGEGCFDAQSLCGKVISGIADAAARAGTRVAVIAGQVALARHEYRRRGIVEALACKTEGMSVEYAIAKAERLLENATRAFATKYLQSA
ncbi:MAG TPA: glycerate kinase [Anaerohalosphaeraceae bacterium]|jgi:glycerate kinase|nr:glycerate kinase [Anaerohalosphaeraceae bacterium]HRT51290.1 glycerate kinase [Anaerohalosphaeraceae bacterium]HRT87237.1 glycerate kinase [Anaerohalosphaeraceae bacterium]